MTTPHAPRRRMKAVGATGLECGSCPDLGVPATFCSHAQSPQQVEGSTASASGDAASRISPACRRLKAKSPCMFSSRAGAYEQTQSAAVLAS